MTPAIQVLQRAKVPFKLHEYTHHAEAESFAMEAAAALNVAPARVFKTLVARCEDGRLAMGIIPADARLSLKLLSAAVGAKRAEMADPAAAERATGYVVGGISPLGGRKALPTVLDQTAMAQQSIFVSAGRRGLQIEIAPADLVSVAKAKTGDILAR